MATHSGILAWRIPWTEEPGWIQSVGSLRVRHDWTTKHSRALSGRRADRWGASDLHFFGKPFMKEESEVAQSCLTVCVPVECSLPGSTIHGILQSRTLEWVAIPSSRGSSRPRDWTQVSCTAGRRFTVWATREAHCERHTNEGMGYSSEKEEFGGCIRWFSSQLHFPKGRSDFCL